MDLSQNLLYILQANTKKGCWHAGQHRNSVTYYDYAAEYETYLKVCIFPSIIIKLSTSISKKV